MQESSGSFVRCKSWPKLRAFLMIFNLNIAADALLYSYIFNYNRYNIIIKIKSITSFRERRNILKVAC